jgi:hypothetical protein
MSYSTFSFADSLDEILKGKQCANGKYYSATPDGECERCSFPVDTLCSVCDLCTECCMCEVKTIESTATQFPINHLSRGDR